MSASPSSVDRAPTGAGFRRVVVSRRIALAGSPPPRRPERLDRSSLPEFPRELPAAEEARSEAHVSAQQSPPRQAARLPAPHVGPGRSGGGPGSPPQGPQAPHGLVADQPVTTALRRDPLASARPQLWRITDRATFAALRASGSRARRGPLSVTWLPPEGACAAEPPRVAFAVGRASGSAVARNRIRRRLRAALRELLVASSLPAGAYLISGRAELVSLPWPELRCALDGAVTSATGTAR